MERRRDDVLAESIKHMDNRLGEWIQETRRQREEDQRRYEDDKAILHRRIDGQNTRLVVVESWKSETKGNVRGAVLATGLLTSALTWLGTYFSVKK